MIILGKRDAYSVLVGEPAVNKPLRRPRPKGVQI
jgi:hypothetical protein